MAQLDVMPGLSSTRATDFPLSHTASPPCRRAVLAPADTHCGTGGGGGCGSCHREDLPDAPRPRPTFSDNEWEQQPGHTQAGCGQRPSQGLHPGHSVSHPTGPQGAGRWALRGREGEGAVTPKREMTETFLLQGRGEGGTPRDSAAINQGPQDER